jgi:phospholipase C
MAKLIPQVKHIVLVMFENRSLDNLCGWLYRAPASPPSSFLPVGSPGRYDGLDPALWNPRNASYFNGEVPDKVPIMDSTTSPTTPNIDPEETFEHVTRQLYGPAGYSTQPRWPMQGFVVDYEYATTGNPIEIMEPFGADQVYVISTLARSYAISDAWFCSAPSQTWPNRAFVHAGTSNGNVNNGDHPNPFDWNVRTVFNVLEDLGLGWSVYSDASLAPTLTRTMFPKLWDPLLSGHFKDIDDFEEHCRMGSLGAYSFIEPNFLSNPNDYHPPHDIRAGERLLLRIWNAVNQSPDWNETLLIITFDEHGGTYDHVLPPAGAITPDTASDPGQNGFHFDRFGVRVPAIMVSPWIEAGTVFRSNTATPLDHTSILATLRDWIGIPSDKMLGSRRVAQAPTIAHVLTRKVPRTDKPQLQEPAAPVVTSTTLPLNDLQKSLITGTATRFGMDPRAVLAGIETRQHALEFFTKRPLAPRSQTKP